MTLRLSANLIGAGALAVLSGDRRQPFFHRRVVYARRMATGMDWRAPLGNRRGIAAVQRIAQQRQLTAFLQREGKPALHFRIKARLHAQVDRAVQQRAGCRDPQLALTDEVFNLRIFFGEIGAPDVTPVDQAGGQQPVGRQTFMQFGDIIFTVDQIDVQPPTGSAAMVARLSLTPSK